MGEYQFIFEYRGSEIFRGDSNPIDPYVIESASSGDTDEMHYYDYSLDPENPEQIRCYFNSWVPVPELSGEPDFIRLPTETTIEGETSGSYAYVTSEHQGIRLVMRLTHSGATHTVYLNRLEKFCGVNEHGERVWQGLVPQNIGTMSMSWNSDQEHEETGYLAIYSGDVTGKTGVKVPSIGFQFRNYAGGSYINQSVVWFFEAVIATNIPDTSDTYEPNNTVLIGGRGTGNYPSDDAESPNTATRNSLFSFGSGSGQGLTYYITTIEDLIKAFTKIYSSSYINEEARINAMIDAFKIPNITIGTQNIMKFWIADINVDVNTAYIMTTRFVEVPLGNVDLSQYGWDDYNDFKNTRATLYLPFVGRINISMDAIARGSIRVLALLDRYTGNVAYWIYTRSMQAPKEVLYGVYEGQSAIQIPFGGSHMVNFMGKFTAMASIFAGGVVAGISGNPIGAGLAGLALVSQAPKALEVGVDTSHAISSTGAATTPYQVRLDIERREMLRPEQYREFASIPAFVTLPLGSMTGFIKIHTADYSGLKCEQSEKELIKEMLEEGVYV